ncbi:hypothetical protein EZS27_014730 [termite gut metagenome]|uniref:Uncharacterized protein n=1 Tax=termite gut metagenome TaxID=433724 RepID=A0A5J4RT49_9ZZZZ
MNTEKGTKKQRLQRLLKPNPKGDLQMYLHRITHNYNSQQSYNDCAMNNVLCFTDVICERLIPEVYLHHLWNN